MSSDRIIVDAIKVAQDLLLQNLPPAHNFTDAATVMRFRELVRSQAIRSALDRSSDTLLTFALRAVERVISDQSRTNRERTDPARWSPVARVVASQIPAPSAREREESWLAIRGNPQNRIRKEIALQRPKTGKFDYLSQPNHPAHSIAFKFFTDD